MKIKLLIVGLVMCLIARGQPNYSKFFGGYHYNDRVAISGGLHIPAMGTPALYTGQWIRSGAIIYDSTGGNKGIHVWNGTTWVRVVDTTWASLVTTKDRFGFTTEDTRATAGRFFSAANQVFTLDSLGHGSLFRQRSRAIVSNTMAFSNKDALDSAYVVLSGSNAGSKVAQIGVSNITIATPTNLGAYLRFTSGGSSGGTLSTEMYSAIDAGDISHMLMTPTEYSFRSYFLGSNRWTNISFFHDSTTWWAGLGRTSVINLFDRAQDQFALDRLAWRTTDSTGKIIIVKNNVEMYAGTNEIELDGPTGITIEPYKQNLYIDSLQHTATATAKMVTWDSTTGRIETRAIPTGGGGGTPGGSDTQLQYNNAGAFGGISGATSNGTIVSLTTPDIVGSNPSISFGGSTRLQDFGSTFRLSGPGGLVDLFSSGSSGLLKVYSPSALSSINVKGTATDLAELFTNGTNNLAIQNGSGLLTGIGTASPSEKLDVAGNVKFSGALMPNNDAGTTGQFLTSSGSGSPPVWRTLTVESNVFTPTLTGVTNVASSSVTTNAGHYIRFGAEVSYTITLSITPTAGATATELDFSLPVASDLATSIDLGGVANLSSGTDISGLVLGDATNNRARIVFTSIGTIAHLVVVSGHYIIK